jgi:predicted metal-binding membrane protein
MPMPGAWSMSMTWMRAPGDSWVGAAGSFAWQWVVMMIAMMLPSLMPVLRRYRRVAAARTDGGTGRLIACAGAGYFAIWTVFGVVAFPVGAVLATLEASDPALASVVPGTVGLIVVAAGAWQFTSWKAHYLACCRSALGHGQVVPLSARTAWKFGVRHGLHCGACCAGMTAVLFALGVMDLRVMAAVTAAITAERILPNGVRAARTIALLTIGLGIVLFTRAIF